MKIAITGAAGMLADGIVNEIHNNGENVFNSPVVLTKSDINQRLPDINKIDVCNIADVENWIKNENPDFLFHLAAETDVDYCEINPDHAYKTNTIGTENCALICQKYGIPMLYISTAAIFNGNKPEPYIEFDEPNPVNIYGLSKLFGEVIVQKLLREYFVVRAGWMIGGWELDKKFVYKIVTQLLDGKRELKVVNDKYGSPTFTVDFAKNILTLINSRRYGLYHMVNKGTATRYEIAIKIIEFMGIRGEVNIKQVSSAEFPLAAPRGRSEMMRNYHLELIGMDNMPYWVYSLEQYIKINIIRGTKCA